MITQETLQFLHTSEGFQLLTELSTADLSDGNTLKLLTDLRKRYSPDRSAAALETARLRAKARDKFGEDAEYLFLTRDALEQASHFAISSLRAERFTGYGVVADLGCGIGADTRMLSKVASVIGVDRDPVRLSMAQWNIALQQRYQVLLLQADLTQTLPFTDVRAAFFDPARRAEGKRIFSVKDYSPSLDMIHQWPFEAMMVKLSPGVDLSELRSYGGSVTFVSLNGELKEAQLGLGDMDNGSISAEVLSVDSQNNVFRETVTALGFDAPPLREPQGYLYEPDPAVIRAGLLSELAQCIDLQMYRADESIAYLTADSLVETPLARAWVIDDWMPFNLKKLRAYLRERGVGQVTVKKRGSPITPEELIAQLKLPGDGEERVVVLTHVMDQPAILICRPRVPAKLAA